MSWEDQLLGFGHLNPQSFQPWEEHEILDKLWGRRSNPFRSRRLADFRPFLLYLRKQCDFLDVDDHLVKDYRTLIKLVGKLKSRRGMTRAAIYVELEGWWAGVGLASDWEERRVTNSLILAVRLWLMVSLGDAGSLIAGSKQLPILWESTASIDGFLKSQFEGPALEAKDKSRNFSDMLSLRDIEFLAGFKIEWTDNILDHLLIRTFPESRFETVVVIFHQATVLEELSKGEVYSRLGVDGALAKETLETLGLLIPARHQTWFDEKLEHYANLDIRSGQQYPVSREVGHYQAWRLRLLRLEEEFDKSKRASVITYWQDRRKPREWATFWVGILVLIFAILAFLLTLLALVAAEITLNETRKANSIAAAASKAADDAATSMVAAFNSSKISPLPIIVCCSANTTSSSGLATTSSSRYISASTINAASLALFTTTILSFSTMTVSSTESITSTIITTV